MREVARAAGSGFGDDLAAYVAHVRRRRPQIMRRAEESADFRVTGEAET
jgi:hypothetical protein